MKEVRQYFASDYAGLEFGKFEFYYGYEYGRDLNDNEVWGFYLEDDKKVRLFQITQDEMKRMPNCPDEWDCQAMLIFGIGLYLNKLESRGK